MTGLPATSVRKLVVNLAKQRKFLRHNSESDLIMLISMFVSSIISSELMLLSTVPPVRVWEEKGVRLGLSRA